MRARGSFLKILLRNRAGATAIEYGLIVSLVFLAIVASFRTVADENNGIWARVTAAVLGVMGDA